MPKKQVPAKQQKEDSFPTPDFLRKQKTSLEAKLANYQNLRRLMQQEIQIPSPDDRSGDALEQAFTSSERQNVARRLEECGKTIPQVKRALDLIDNLLAGIRNQENHGECIDCGEQIPERRLTAVPWAERCIPCQEKKDTMGQGADNPAPDDHSQDG